MVFSMSTMLHYRVLEVKLESGSIFTRRICYRV
jgi:hypothetical protein